MLKNRISAMISIFPNVQLLKQNIRYFYPLLELEDDYLIGEEVHFKYIGNVFKGTIISHVQ